MKNNTIVVQIGNSDDKLTQLEWSEFCNKVREVLKYYCEIHFDGSSPTDKPWQNHCFVGEIDLTDGDLQRLLAELVIWRAKHKQDSIAVVLANTSFI